MSRARAQMPTMDPSARPRALGETSVIVRWLGTAGCVLVLGCGANANTPGGTCIAPANPGGGWDFSCRAISLALGTRAPGGQVLRVINLPGEGGGVAFRRVVSDSASSQPLIVAASPSTLLGLAQGHYGNFSEKSVRWIAAMDAEPSVIAVSASAPWRTLDEFVRAWRAHPDSVVIGGTSDVGGQDHMKMLLLARAAGLAVRLVRYRPISSTTDAIAQLRSNAIQVFPAELSKMLPQVQGKQLRVLAVLGQKRAMGPLASVPTAREQGFDVVFVVWRGFYAPRGISEATYREWVAGMSATSASPEWKATLARNGLAPYFLAGKEFETFVTNETAAYRTLSKEIGIIP